MQSDPSISAQPAAGLHAVPLFHAAWLFAPGIAIASRVWLRPSLLLIALALVAALCAVAALRAQRIAWLAAGGAVAAAGRVVRGNGAASCARAGAGRAF